MKFSMFSQPPRQTPRNRIGCPSGPRKLEPEVRMKGAAVLMILLLAKVSRRERNVSDNLRDGGRGVNRSATTSARPVRDEVLGHPDGVGDDGQGRIHTAVGRVQRRVADDHPTAAPQP